MSVWLWRMKASTFVFVGCFYFGVEGGCDAREWAGRRRGVGLGDGVGGVGGLECWGVRGWGTRGMGAGAQEGGGGV